MELVGITPQEREGGAYRHLLPLLLLIRRAAMPWEGDIRVWMKHGPKHHEVKQEIMTWWGKGGCQEPPVRRGQWSEDVRKMRHQHGGWVGGCWGVRGWCVWR